MSTLGVEAIELAAMAGLELDDWQRYVLGHSLGERDDGKWAAFEVGVEVARQNGKGALLEARELIGLFLLGEKLMIHSAHEFATAEEALERMDNLLEANPDLSRRVKTIKRSHGQEGVYLKNGNRLRYRTRTKGGGRGFSADWLALDEAMIVPEAMHGALMPTLSARPNPQVWYTGSAVDQTVHEHGVVFARLRQRALEGTDPSLAYFGWSVAAESPDDLDDDVATDPEAWAQGNPGLSIRITCEHVGREQRSMDARTFAVERLGVGDWPDPDDDGEHIIDREVWAGDADLDSQPSDQLSLAFDVAPDRSWSSISVGAPTDDDLEHVEVVARRRGTRWVPQRLRDLVIDHGADVVVVDGVGPAASLIPEVEEILDDLDVEVVVVSAKEYAQACGGFYDAAVGDDEADPTLRHVNQPALNAAVKGAAKRSLSDAWAWSRKSSAVDITPLVSATLAHWASRTRPDGESVYQQRDLIVLN